MVVASTTFKAEEQQLLKVFSNDYRFEMPRYQRPYAWGDDQTQVLLEDLQTAIAEEADDGQPYFLGCIVLTELQGKNNAYAVVDGQQRLTTLTILFCVLRELAEHEGDKQNLDSRVRESADRFAGTEDRFRLQLRERDQDFFQENVQKPGRLEELVKQETPFEIDSRERIRQNATYLWEKLKEMPSADRDALAEFLLQKSYMVVVTASSPDAAHRIFSVLNARGLDLSPTDILKAEVIGAVPVNSELAYVNQWESIEEDLGRQEFRELFGHIYTIYQKRKPIGLLDQAFKENILDKETGTKFIDEVLIPYSDIYRKILDASIENTGRDVEINRCIARLNRLTNTISFWVAPAMEFVKCHPGDGERLLRLLKDLERLTYGLLFLPVLRDSRRFRYESILKDLSTESVDLFGEKSALQLTSEECKDIASKLDEPLAFLKPSHLKRALLLKLDELLADTGATYEHKTITVEHVLPQNPSEDSEWLKVFSKEERDEWTDRLANLVLLSRTKNSRAQNYEFDRKKTEYFSKNGVAPFALTTRVVNETEWNPRVLERLQRELIDLLSSDWRLKQLDAESLRLP